VGKPKGLPQRESTLLTLPNSEAQACAGSEPEVMTVKAVSTRNALAVERWPGVLQEAIANVGANEGFSRRVQFDTSSDVERKNGAA
jgi:hypothetical protein